MSKLFRLISNLPKYQTGGSTIGGPNMQISSAGLMNAPRAQAEAFQTIQGAPAGQISTAVQSARNAIESKRATAVAEDQRQQQLNIAKAEESRKFNETLYTQLSDIIKSNTDGKTKLYTPIYGEDIVKQNKAIADIANRSSELMKAGDGEGAYSLIFQAKTALLTDTKSLVAQENSGVMTTLANIRDLAQDNLKSGQSIDKRGIVDAIQKAEDLLRKNPYKRLTDNEDIRKLLSDDYVYDKTIGQAAVAAVAGQKSAEKVFSLLGDSIYGNAQLQTAFNKAGNNAKLSTQDYTDMLWASKEVRTYLQNDLGIETDDDLIKYLDNQRAIIDPEQAGDIVEAVVDYSLTEGGMTTKDSSEAALAREKAKLKGGVSGGQTPSSNLSKYGQLLSKDLRDYGLAVSDANAEALAKGKTSTADVKAAYEIYAKAIESGKTPEEAMKELYGEEANKIFAGPSGARIIAQTYNDTKAQEENLKSQQVKFDGDAAGNFRVYKNLAGDVGDLIPDESELKTNLGFYTNNLLNLKTGNTELAHTKKHDYEDDNVYHMVFNTLEDGIAAAINTLNRYKNGKNETFVNNLKNDGKTIEEATLSDLYRTWATSADEEGINLIAENIGVSADTNLSKIPTEDLLKGLALKENNKMYKVLYEGKAGPLNIDTDEDGLLEDTPQSSSNTTNSLVKDMLDAMNGQATTNNVSVSETTPDIVAEQTTQSLYSIREEVQNLPDEDRFGRDISREKNIALQQIDDSIKEEQSRSLAESKQAAFEVSQIEKAKDVVSSLEDGKEFTVPVDNQGQGKVTIRKAKNADDYIMKIGNRESPLIKGQDDLIDILKTFKFRS